VNQFVFYEDRYGESEIFRYVSQLSQSHRPEDVGVFKKLTYQLELLDILGNRMHEPHAKQLRGLKYPLWELRPMPERIFYAYWRDDQYVLLHHYTKRQDKTDLKEITKALMFLDDWLLRKGN
jgi:phage-related protein